MNEKEILKYLDKLILNLPKHDPFDVEHEVKKLESKLNLKGEIVPYLKVINQKLKHFKYIKENQFNDNLSDIGINAQEKGGHFKYQNSLKKKPLDWYKIIPIIIAIIFGSLNVYQKYDYNSLKLNFDVLKVQNDSLITELDSLKLKLIDVNNNNSVNKGVSLKTKKEFD